VVVVAAVAGCVLLLLLVAMVVARQWGRQQGKVRHPSNAVVPARQAHVPMTFLNPLHSQHASNQYAAVEAELLAGEELEEGVENVEADYSNANLAPPHAASYGPAVVPVAYATPVRPDAGASNLYAAVGLAPDVNMYDEPLRHRTVSLLPEYEALGEQTLSIDTDLALYADPTASWLVSSLDRREAENFLRGRTDLDALRCNFVVREKQRDRDYALSVLHRDVVTHHRLELLADGWRVNAEQSCVADCASLTQVVEKLHAIVGPQVPCRLRGGLRQLEAPCLVGTESADV
jgi:hypothetical protein